MAKPKNIDRPKEKNLSLPGSLVDRIDLALYSEVEGRVPHGAWAKMLTNTLTNKFIIHPQLREELVEKIKRVKLECMTDPELRDYHIYEALFTYLNATGQGEIVEAIGKAGRYVV